MNTNMNINADLRIGNGFDVHAFCQGDHIILGGINIPFEYSLEGHSDADVLTHSIIDSILGALGMPDIGELFPDSDAEYKDISSILLLEAVLDLARQKRPVNILNIDCNVICESPRISPWKEKIKNKLSQVLQIDTDRINIKGKTMERLGAIGRGDGIMALTSCLIQA